MHSLLLILLFSTYGCIFTDASCRKTSNKDIEGGGGLDPVHNTPESACCITCRNKYGCKAYVHNNDNNGTCYLKTATGPIISKHGFNVGVIEDGRRDGSCIKEFNIDIDGGAGLNPVNNTPEASCCGICQNMDGCRAYVHNNYENGTCWLKTATRPLIYKAGVIMGVVQEAKSGMSNSMKALTIVGIAILLLLVLGLTIVLIFAWRREKGKDDQLKELYKSLRISHRYFKNDRTGEESVILDPETPLNNQIDILGYDVKYEIERSWLKLGEIIGEGQFGIVYRGTLVRPDPNVTALRKLISGVEMLEPISVAVKVPKEGRNPMHQKSLLEELKIMVHLGGHPNVLRLVAALTKLIPKGELYVVIDFCHQGEIQDNWESDLFESRLTRQFVTTSDLTSWAYQISNGMEFLAENYLIHRDLAARNILLTENLVAKIADFGLARQKEEYYISASRNVPLPMKWMALETLVDHYYTIKSDVWSFGVVMWEIFSLGNAPYASQPLDYNFINFLKEGNRLSKPDFSPIKM